MMRLADAGSMALRSLATPTGRVRAANLLLGVAAAALVVTTWRAVRVDPLPDAAPATVTGAAAGDVIATRGPRDDADEIDNDPFRIDRQLPEPEESAEYATMVAEAAEPAIAPESVRLLGTVVLPAGRSFVVLQLPSQPARTLRIGERIGQLRLDAVQPGRATFRAPDGARIELHLSKPGG